jgi:SAM-dependent methyltransferase
VAKARDLQRSFYNEAYPVLAENASSEGTPSLLQRLELHRTDAVLRMLPRGGRLLDVGCGDGGLLAKCARDFDEVIGVDVADTQLWAARRRLSTVGVHNATLVQANVDRGLPFRDEQFDAVTLVAVLGFIFDPLTVLSEVRRVLKSGGCLAVEVLNLVYLPRRLGVVSGRLPRHTNCYGWEGGQLHNFTRDALGDLLRDRGFEVQRSGGSGVLAGLRSWWPGLLLGNVIALGTKR